jgi:Uncharacterized protein involved in exopolysaccharide biosynthesis
MEDKIKENRKRSDEISLKELILQIKSWFNYLLSKWKTILIVVLIGAVLGVLYSSSKGTLYKAVTTFVLEEDGARGGLGQYAGIAAIAGLDIGGNGGGLFTGDNILELYKSRSMIKKALLSSQEFNGKKQSLIDRYIELNGLRQKWDANPKIKNITFVDNKSLTVEQDSLLSSIIQNIRNRNLLVGYLEKSKSIIKVEVENGDPLFAKAFNEKIVATVNDFYIQTKAKKSLANLMVLQHQVDSVNTLLNGAVFKSAEILDATPNLNPTRQVLRASVERSRFNAEANKEVLSELLKNLELSKISVRKDMPLIQTIDVPVLPLEKERLSKSKGVIIGGFLSGFLIVFMLSSIFFYKKIMSSE